MARVTTEDCITSIPNRFQLVIYSCRRARELLSGNEANVSLDNDKQTVIALREIADKKLDLNKVWENIVANAQDQAVPLNENASQVSFDNFEKENASEKKRKKIYMTESEINKLIENRKSEKGDGEDIEDEYDDVDDIEEKIEPNPEEDTKK